MSAAGCHCFDLDKCEQTCRGVHDKEFEPTEASEISWPSVSDGFDDDNVCGRNETEMSKLSLSGILYLEFVESGVSFIKCEQTNETLVC